MFVGLAVNVNVYRRSLAVLLFLVALGWSYQRSVPPLVPVLTEDGQNVVFPRGRWQGRELAKLLPLGEPWPAPAQLRQVLRRYGLDRGAPPENIPMPSRITSDVYLVGQDLGGNLTYLVDCGSEGAVVIDPTFESEFEKTLARVEQCGIPRRSIRWVLNTHCHMDHAMADAKFREAGAQIMVHEADADAIEKASRVTAYYFVARQRGTPGLRFPKCPIDRRLSDGEELQLGNKLFHVIHTPGHTPGSSSFLLQIEGKNLLISGDTVFYDSMLGWQLNPYADDQRYLASLDKLMKFRLDAAPFQWDMLLPGHGAIAMDKAWLDVKRDRETLAGDVAAGREVQVTPHARPEYRKRMFGLPAAGAARQ